VKPQGSTNGTQRQDVAERGIAQVAQVVIGIALKARVDGRDRRGGIIVVGTSSASMSPSVRVTRARSAAHCRSTLK